MAVAKIKKVSAGIENRLWERRRATGLSQKQLADMVGITRQAVSAIETNQYSPATSVALELARALHCRVEDLFSIKSSGETIEGELIGSLPHGKDKVRAQVTWMGDRLLVRPLDCLGELTSLSVTADGLINDVDPGSNRVKVSLLKERAAVRQNIVVGGCDPAIFVAAEHLRKHAQDNLVPCLMGSSLALGALTRGEVHVAGIHLANDDSGRWELPDLKHTLGDIEFLIVTFAHWEEGFIIRQGNPKRIRAVSDIAKPKVKIVNREIGSGARYLLDKQLKASGIKPNNVKGYRDEVFSHLDVALRIKAGLADTGIGVRAAASITGLDFVPLQHERYDLVIPKVHYETLQGMKHFLDVIVSKHFRQELEALGGYDTRETGAVQDLTGLKGESR